MTKVGDKFILHSANGMDYDIEVINVNDFREPSMKYGVDVHCNGVYVGDVMFVDDALLNKCEEVRA